MNTITIFIFLAALCISNFSKAQVNEDPAGSYLKGMWTASCPPEIVDLASVRHCQLCPFVINADDKKEASIKEFEMNILTDSITFNQNENIATVPYKRNMNNHSISFLLNGKSYNFRMFLYGAQRILVDTDGLLLVLDKVK